MKSRAWYRQLDLGVVFAWAGLLTVGLVAIYSSTHGPAAEYLLETVKQNFNRQLQWAGIALVVAVVCLTRPARFFYALGPVAYVTALVLLVATALFGRTVNGAKGWLYIGPFGLQTAEFAKVATLLAVAQLLASRRPKTSGLRYGIGATILLLVPAAIIIGPQNDTGTGLVFLGLIPIMLFWSELPLHVLALMLAPAVAGYFAIISLPVAVAFVLLFAFGIQVATRNRRLALAALALTGGVTAAANTAIHVLQPHQVARIVSFTNPEAEEYRSNVGYHLVQSKLAIGSGGVAGKGFMKGTQTQGAYIPEQSTDFVFSIVGEEWGFVGSLVVLGLYGLLLLRLVRVGTQMRNPFGSMMAAGTAGVFLIHLFVNLGMVTGLLPVIGIPLPFISYGGSALLANSLMLAVVLTLHMRRDDFSLYGGG